MTNNRQLSSQHNKSTYKTLLTITSLNSTLSSQTKHHSNKHLTVLSKSKAHQKTIMLKNSQVYKTM